MERRDESRYQIMERRQNEEEGHHFNADVKEELVDYLEYLH